jgi:esterase/lipase
MKKVFNILKWTGIVLSILFVILASVYLLGPRPARVEISNNPLKAVETLPSADKAPGLKKNNEARIIWADSSKQKTAYSIVYLHGFSAGPMEAEPLHRELAARYGCNLYLERMKGHGIDDLEAFTTLTARDMVESAKEAIAIGKAIGEKVILLSCSTGGTLALYLSAKDPEIVANILLSPNIALADPNSFVLTGPWGLQIGRFFMGGKYRSWTPENDSVKQYWTSKYRVEGIIAVKQLVEQTMNKEIFAAVKKPVFLGYYFKNEKEQDQTVSVAAMLKMFDQLGSPADQKVKKAFPNAGTHVICSKWQSKDLDAVKNEINNFMDNVLKLKAVN